jgi:hypothetical protein
MYFEAGPLSASFPIMGLTATTFSFLKESSFRIPGIEVIGPILEIGLPGAITIISEFLIASSALPLGTACSIPLYLMFEILNSA